MRPSGLMQRLTTSISSYPFPSFRGREHSDRRYASVQREKSTKFAAATATGYLRYIAKSRCTMTPGRITSSFITAALGAAVACMLGLVLWTLSALAQSGRPLEKITFLLDFVPYGKHAPF